MKHRWSVLLGSSLVSLIGMSWLASSLGISVTNLVGVSLIGMVIATVLALWAMVTNHASKAPAAIVLVCAGPMAVDCLCALPDIVVIVRFVGLSYGMVIAGTVATIASASWILLAPQAPPPVAPVRVID